MTKPSTAPTMTRVPKEGWAFNPLVHARRITLSFLQGLFQEFKPGSYHWSSDSETEIFITDESPVDLTDKERRPSILCGRGAMQFNQLTIGDFHSADYLLTQRRQSDLLSMNLAVVAIADSDIESDEIAWICANHMWTLRTILIQNGFHEFGRGIRVDPPSAAGELVQGTGTDDWKKTVVIVPTYFMYSNFVEPENLRKLQGIIMHMSAEVGTHLEVTPSTVGIVGTGIGRRLPDGSFEVPRQRQVPRSPVNWEKQDPVTPEPGLSIRVEV